MFVPTLTDYTLRGTHCPCGGTGPGRAPPAGGGVNTNRGWSVLKAGSQMSGFHFCTEDLKKSDD
ncbi:putative tRNA sulfurtransferase, partial [Clarias magur]